MSDLSPRVAKISLGSLSRLNKYVRQNNPLSSTMGEAEYQSDQPLWEMLGAASDPHSSPDKLREILASDSHEAIELAIYNPSLPISDAANYLIQEFESLRSQRSIFLRDLSIDEFNEKFDFDNWDMDSEELEDFTSLLAVMQGQDVDTLSYQFEDEVADFIFDVYVIVTQGREDQRKLLEKLHPDLSQFMQNLVDIKLIDPFAFWTTNVSGLKLTREKMLGEHDGQVLIAEDSIFDMGAVGFLGYPEEFKPLYEVDETWIYNIEGGTAAVSNQIFSSEPTKVVSSIQKYETDAGLGDGYYPTIPFFDAFGQLQTITTFFIHMMNSEVLDSYLEDKEFASRSSLFENRLPIKLGYLRSTGSVFFGDSFGLSLDSGPTYQIVQFEEVPEDDYLVVAFIDTEERTWALSLTRDRAKRSYEILFKIFPELVRIE
jgi:hypothetical protein